MFPSMRRHSQQLPEKEMIEVLQSSSSGTLALLSTNGYPYAVPLSYLYHQGKLYFHSAQIGHKIDAIRHHNKASFCIVVQDEVIPEQYTTYYQSVIAFGTLRILDDLEEIKAIAFELGEKYNPNHNEQCHKEVQTSYQQVAIIEMTIDHITGKEAKELMLNRKAL